MELVRRKFAQVQVGVRSGVCAITVLLGAIAGSGRAQVPCRWEVAKVFTIPNCGFLPNGISANAISPNGRWVVGAYGDCATETAQPFIYDTQTGVLTPIPKPAWVIGAVPYDVNDHAVVVGTMTRPVPPYGPYTRGFVYVKDTGSWSELPPVNEFGWSEALAVNNRNTVCGARSIGGKEGENIPFQAYTWREGLGFNDLGEVIWPGSMALDINDSDSVVGYAGVMASVSQRGFVHESGVTTIVPPIPGGLWSGVFRINDQGMMLVHGGIEEQFPYTAHSYRVHGSTWTQLFPLPGFVNPGGIGLSSDGTVVGRSSNPFPMDEWRATIWRCNMAIDIAEFLPQRSGIRLEYTRSISDNHWFVAQGFSASSDQIAVLFAPVLPRQGDTDCSERIDMDDILNVITAWGPCLGCSADLNGDQSVNVQDLMLVITNWDYNR